MRARQHGFGGDPLPFACSNALLCSPQCLEKEARVIFDHVSSPPPDAPPKHRVPLGLLMLEHGYLSELQLRKGLETQARERRGRIGEWLQDLHFVTERQVLAVLGVRWACPLLSLREEPDTAGSGMLPVPLLRALHLFPVRYIAATRLLYIAVSLELNYRVPAAIDQITDCPAMPCLVEDGKMHAWLRRTQNQHHVQVFDRSSEPAEMARITGSYVARLGSEEVRIVRCGPYLWARLMGGERNGSTVYYQGHAGATEYGEFRRSANHLPGGLDRGGNISEEQNPCHPFDSPSLIHAVEQSTADTFGR